MLKECKKAMGYGGKLSDGEIARLCRAGAMDMMTRGVLVPGKVDFTITEEAVADPVTGETRTIEKVTDNSTLTDELCMRAIITYAKAHFGNPPNYQNLISSYETQLGQLMNTSGYTDYSMVRE